MPRCTREALDPANQASVCPGHAPDADTSDDAQIWDGIDFAEADGPTYPPAHADYEQWMARPPEEKYPYAPWTDPDAPAECSKSTCIDHGDGTAASVVEGCPDCRKHREGTTTAECGHHAGYKWGYQGNYRALEGAKRGALDANVGGLVFIQLESDPFVFVDGDDVRDPETGNVHPRFLAILDRLGLSYADVSTSGAGVHVYYRGDLPNDDTVAKWQLDDQPLGANEDPPAIEIYSGKHVCLTTGDHVTGTPHEVRPWDSEALREVLEEADESTPDEHTVLTSFDTRDAPAPEETGSNGSDVGSSGGGESSPVVAVGRLNARRVAEDTIVKEWTDPPSETHRAFLPTWGSRGDGGTANFVNRDVWKDTGQLGGYGGPIEMAAIDINILPPREAEPGAVSGEDWWQAYEHLQDLGFPLPDRVERDQYSDYYDAPLEEHTDGDPYSEPFAMLEACLQVRARGLVDGDADPPTLALVAIASELLDETEVSSGTKEMLADVYHDELDVTSISDGELSV